MSETPYTLAAKDDLQAVINIGKVFAFLSLLVILFYWGFVYNNLLFFKGYPRYGSGLPGPLTDNRLQVFQGQCKTLEPV